MSDQQVSNLNVLAQDVLTTPEALKNAIPLTESAERSVIEGRQTIQNILDGKDPRLLVVVGPCSIHDVEAALDYARRLRTLADQVLFHECPFTRSFCSNVLRRALCLFRPVSRAFTASSIASLGHKLIIMEEINRQSSTCPPWLCCTR